MAPATKPPNTNAPNTNAPDPEAHLTATALRLWQGGAAAQADVAARLRAAFGAGPGNAVAAALDRVSTVLHATPATDPDAIALLVAATLQDTDADETARLIALGLVPAHRMQALVDAARGLALALRRAVLTASGPRRCPARHP